MELVFGVSECANLTVDAVDFQVLFYWFTEMEIKIAMCFWFNLHNDRLKDLLRDGAARY